MVANGGRGGTKQVWRCTGGSGVDLISESETLEPDVLLINQQDIYYHLYEPLHLTLVRYSRSRYIQKMVYD